jgi:hypothetical protein
MRESDIWYFTPTTPISRSAGRKVINSRNMHDIEVSHPLTESTPHSWRKHVLARPGPPPKIPNLYTSIEDRVIKGYFQMLAPVHIA